MSGREQQRLALLAVASALMVLGLLGALVADVGRPFPGFLFTLGHRIVPVDSDAVAGGLRFGDRIVTVDGASPITLASRIERSGALEVTVPVSVIGEGQGRYRRKGPARTLQASATQTGVASVGAAGVPD